jgi:pilus assembly protein CpaB
MNINMKTIILVGIAILLAGGAAFMARSLVNKPAQQTSIVSAPVESKLKVLVAIQSLPLGHFLKTEEFEWRAWPAQNINENYITNETENPDELMQSFIGSIVKVPVLSGVPLLRENIVHPRNRGFLAAVLKNGHRALTARINLESGIAGFIFPGDRVDILLTHPIRIGDFDDAALEEMGDSDNSNRKQAFVTETILTNIKVLAIDQRTTAGELLGAPGKSVTFELTPKQAEKMTLVPKIGTLSLALRPLGKTPEEEVAENKANGKSKMTAKITRTWDSEVSKVIPNLPGFGPDKTATGGKKTYKIEVVRGTKVQKLKYVK